MHRAIETQSSNCRTFGITEARRGSRHWRLVAGALLLAGVMVPAVPVLAQQKTGPGLPADDSLTWHGITLYGVIDLGVQFDTHSAPFTP